MDTFRREAHVLAWLKGASKMSDRPLATIFSIEEHLTVLISELICIELSVCQSIVHALLETAVSCCTSCRDLALSVFYFQVLYITQLQIGRYR